MKTKPVQERDFFSILQSLSKEEEAIPAEREEDLKTRLEAKKELFELMCKGGYLTPDCAKDLRTRIDAALTELDQIMKALDEETIP